MLKPEPPDGALPLLEAFLQFGDPDAAKLVRERPSRLWLLDQDGPVAEAKDAFLDRLRHGQLVAWARHPGEFGGRRWFLVRAADWAQIKVADWQCGSLVRVIEPSRWQRSRRVQRVTVGWDARVAEYTVEPRTEPLERKGPGGAPPKPYKNDVIEKAIEWLEDEGEQPQAEVVRYLEELISQLDPDGGPSHSTLKNWAKEALAEFQRRLPPLDRN